MYEDIFSVNGGSTVDLGIGRYVPTWQIIERKTKSSHAGVGEEDRISGN